MAAYQHYVPRIGRPPAPMTADYPAAVRRGQAWVAAAGGEVAGFIILIPQPGYLLLENVAVLPAAQGRGIGARLLALAEDRARALHLPRDTALHQRGDDREPGLLPAARVHPDPPGAAGRLLPCLLPQTGGHLTARIMEIRAFATRTAGALTAATAPDGISTTSLVLRGRMVVDACAALS